ncbi:MAG: transglutaminase family protein [Rhizobiaceae bacterium]|nr:transglutaminase family protein [Rhizobiaceae bacterium]
MRLSITHKTHYQYDAPVDYALQQVRLTPANTRQQTVRSWNVEVEGGKTELNFSDQYNNQTLLVSIDQGGREISLTASGEVEILDSSGVLGEVYGYAPLWHFTRPSELTQPGKAIRKLAKHANSDDLLASLHVLSSQIAEIVEYSPGQTYAATSAEDALTGGHGVCQDHAQIFIAAARVAGVPARYVSGYLMMNDRVDQDATHAWAEAHVDGLGWVGFDVSNGISPDDRYVRIATGLDYRDAAPISGMRRGSANESMIVSVQVQQ